MKWTVLWLGLNLAAVVRGLTQPERSPWLLLNAFSAGLLAMVWLIEFVENA